MQSVGNQSAIKARLCLAQRCKVFGLPATTARSDLLLVMWRSALVAVAAVAAYALGQHYFEGPGMCPHDPAACFFSDTYLAARMAFREAAKRVGAELHVLRVSETPDLTIDVAVLQGATPSKRSEAPPDGPPTLIHMSGTHGVEAHAGSAVQLALLQKWADEPASAPMVNGVRVVLVHAVNPYGFHCGRRFNEQGADLNRNVLSDSEFASMADDTERRALYEDHEWLFNWPTSWAPMVDDLRFLVRTVYAIVFKGFVSVKRVIVAGQYHKNSGLYYGGGPSMAQSHQLLLPLLRRVAAPASAVVLIDVHSGLGPMGVDTLMPHLNPREKRDEVRNLEALQAIFGQASAGDSVLGVDYLIDAPNPSQASSAAASAGYELARGSTAEYVHHVNGWKRALHVTQEFGTLPAPLVLRGMIIERAEWLHHAPTAVRPGQCNGTAMGAKAARDAFYVRRRTWQNRVVRRGMILAAQAADVLGREPGRVPSRAPLVHGA